MNEHDASNVAPRSLPPSRGVREDSGDSESPADLWIGDREPGGRARDEGSREEARPAAATTGRHRALIDVVPRISGPYPRVAGDSTATGARPRATTSVGCLAAPDALLGRADESVAAPSRQVPVAVTPGAATPFLADRTFSPAEVAVVERTPHPPVQSALSRRDLVAQRILLALVAVAALLFLLNR